jgi:plastocyanin
MTSPLRISFSLLLLAAAAWGANVTGSVELADSRDSSVRKKRNFSGVALWLEPAGAAPALPAATLTITQKDKKFSPHISLVPTGTTVDFPNFDPIFHNAFSNFAGQPFDTGLYPPGSTRKVRFARPGVVRVFCNIHSTMSAVIVVVSTPYTAITGTNGAFSMANVPPGEYTLKLWHERATEATLNRLTRRVTVGSGGLALGTITISESGYLPVPHTNKHGQQYPPEPTGPGAYSGARK